MIFNHIILATLWILYCVLHSVLASEWVKKKMKQALADYKWYRIGVLIICLYFFNCIVLLPAEN